ncbi:DUF3604 domain-containing protein [Robertkochia marina]|uniref:DUF3604 domain-containing protein n=1 Tax=Robertkochia marina TaxID=1227945 RepID=A0A4S3M1Z9_9FLAO|nr:DUF3604 domain-containing protein [Robertkochia marina]THD68860.1 DUF3604 domain-containing protein [Robertkochia marina]TRZ41105.1 DUF3604 domain-containing protein [Robertkochia marina]
MLRITTLLFALILTISCKTDKKESGDTTNPASTTSDTSTEVAQNPLKEAYFGNLHVHTKWSFDAYINSAATGPDEAYQWAQGQAIPGGGDGTPLQLSKPLDWYAVSDHAEYLGALPYMEDENSIMSTHPLAGDITGDDPAASFAAYGEISDGIYTYQRRDSILGDPEFATNIWKEMVGIADKHYKPGKFTTFAAFEWTAAPDWRNIHRIVLFKDTKKVPEAAFSAVDSSVPEELWKWMDNQRSQGNELLAVPHNGNASDGIMFPIGESYGGSTISKEYATTRMRNEPVYELIQIKGVSETHPELSPNDEFGNFEIWDYTLAAGAIAPKNKRGGYMREALIRSLKYEQEGNGNPFKYGFIGDSDTHNSYSPIEEDDYHGKFGFENSPEHRLDGPPGVDEKSANQVRRFGSAGLAGVWAKSNTREEIFEAIMRKETFATSGPRLRVRFFGGFDFTRETLAESNWLEAAYNSGVPMGGDLYGGETNAPSFIIHAMKDPDGANLDRIQIIKGWVDADGNQQEKIYNVALSGDREVAADGSAPEVGNTVNGAEATYTNDIGGVELQTVWTDPDFDPSLYAVYYARVLEIPTPRWSTYDAKALGRELRDDLPVSIQERAWSSPIWYTPAE